MKPQARYYWSSAFSSSIFMENGVGRGGGLAAPTRRILHLRKAILTPDGRSQKNQPNTLRQRVLLDNAGRFDGTSSYVVLVLASTGESKLVRQQARRRVGARSSIKARGGYRNADRLIKPETPAKFKQETAAFKTAFNQRRRGRRARDEY